MSLGRGLSSLIPQRNPAPVSPSVAAADAPALAPAGGVFEVPLSSIVINPHQPRHYFDEGALEELADSIKEHGVIQPILVADLGNNRYQLVAGERRFRASKMAGKTAIPAHVRSVTAVEKLTLAIVENLQREDLNPLEEAIGFEQLGAQFGMTQEDIAKKTGKSRSTIANTLRLLKLPQEVQEAIAQGLITEGHAKAIASLSEFSQQMELFRKVVHHKMSVREAEAQAHKAEGVTKKIANIDPHAIDMSVTLTKTLGHKVKIRNKKRGGEIIISYSSSDDLKTLNDKLLHLR